MIWYVLDWNKSSLVARMNSLEFAETSFSTIIPSMFSMILTPLEISSTLTECAI